MTRSNQSRNRSEEVTLTRSLGLLDATMIGVGGMIGAGIFVLTGIAAGVAGPASILAFALNGVVTLLTALCYAELTSCLPRAGGGYTFIRRAFPGIVGFLSGWGLWFAYTVACSLYAAGLASYVREFLSLYLGTFQQLVDSLLGAHGAIILYTLFMGSIFIGLNAWGAAATGKTENVITIAKIFALGVFALFGLLVAFRTPAESIGAFTPFFPRGIPAVFIAMGLTFIAFQGYDLIATASEEIKRPERTIPRAIVFALVIAVSIYLLIVFVSLASVRVEGMASWQFLGKYKETAIVRAAQNFMPAFGVVLIVLGGLLSTMSALNATILASSRVAFSMGRDRWLPAFFSVIHRARRTPHLAILATGILLLLVAISLPIEALGSAASLIFLITFAFVNLSLIVIRRKHPELRGGFRIPLYPVVPFVGLAANIGLAVSQFWFRPVAWYLVIGWMLAGYIVYQSYFGRITEKEKPKVLPLPAIGGIKSPKMRILVPIGNPDNVAPLLDIALPIAREFKGLITVVSVVKVPRQTPIEEGLRFAHHGRSILDAATAYASKKAFKIRTRISLAHRVVDGILDTVEREESDLLIAGWKGYPSSASYVFGEITDHLLRQNPCDLVVLKRSRYPFKKIMLATGGGPNAELASRLLKPLAKEHKATVTLATALPEQRPRAYELRGRQILSEIEAKSFSGFPTDKIVLKGKTIAGAIARASKVYDLVVIGASREPFLRKIIAGEIPVKVARFSHASVILVKRYEGPLKKWFKRTFG
ncbi:MAG: hypothetical protein B1H03_00240 [Planctomycetales bacterium 4484_113]|nr:MAG: hypothetical protein B1H03_00240 [Planctomycetales bacterium 4484_113]